MAFLSLFSSGSFTFPCSILGCDLVLHSFLVFKQVGPQWVVNPPRTTNRGVDRHLTHYYRQTENVGGPGLTWVKSHPELQIDVECSRSVDAS